MERLLPWIWFAIVHVWVATAGLLMPNFPTGDVVLVYEPWSTKALAGSGIVGVTETWVYPQLALAPMILAHALTWLGSYTIAWAALVTLLDAAAFWMLLGRGRSRGRRLAAWFWLAFLVATGPIGMYRIDAITVPIAIVGLCLLATRPTVAGAILAAGMWIKIWPVAALGAAFVAMRKRWSVVVGAVLTTALVVGVVLLSGGAKHLAGFLTTQEGRGLQIEAPISTLFLWGTAVHADGFFVYYDSDILTYQATGTNVDVYIAVMTPLLALALAAVLVVGYLQAGRGVRFVRLVPPLLLALVLVLIVFNKVGSPQFQVWLVAPIVLWLVVDRRAALRPAIGVLVLGALTQLIYPLLYNGLLVGDIPTITVLTARNALLVGMLVWMVVRVVRLPVGVAALREARARVA